MDAKLEEKKKTVDQHLLGRGGEKSVKRYANLCCNNGLEERKKKYSIKRDGRWGACFMVR